MRQIVKAFAEASGREIPTRMAPRRPGDVAQVMHPPGGRGVPWETGVTRARGSRITPSTCIPTPLLHAGVCRSFACGA